MGENGGFRSGTGPAINHRMGPGGRIVNLSTLNTVVPVAGHLLYAMSKGALEQATAVASRELGPRGITVNAVSPGAVATDMLRRRRHRLTAVTERE